MNENKIPVAEVFLILSEALENEILMGVSPVWVIDGEVSMSIRDRKLGDITTFNKREHEKMKACFSGLSLPLKITTEFSVRRRRSRSCTSKDWSVVMR